MIRIAGFVAIVEPHAAKTDALDARELLKFRRL
jgi:hypothetical protein